MNRKLVMLIVFLFIMSIILFFYFKSNLIKNIKIISDYEKNHRYIIDIKYPKTKIRKLDTMITDYINKQKNYFLNHYGDSDYLIDCDEFTIDYKYHLHSNSYISIVLITYINSYKLPNPIYEVNTFFYDVNGRKRLVLNDILLDETKMLILSNIKNIIRSQYPHAILESNVDIIISKELLGKNNFFIDDDNLTFYLTPDVLSSDYYDLIEIPIQLKSLGFSVF